MENLNEDYWFSDVDEPAVLVVDDNLVVVKLVIQTLQPHGLRCHWGRSVKEAKQILQVFPIDLIISDIRPPYTDGIALAEWVRAQASISDTPILFFTSSSDRETIQQAAAVKDVDYVLKPLRAGIFCERVLRMLGRQAQPEPGKKLS